MIQGATIRRASAMRTGDRDDDDPGQPDPAPESRRARARTPAPAGTSAHEPCPRAAMSRRQTRVTDVSQTSTAHATSPASRARAASSVTSSRPTSAAASAMRQRTASSTASPPAASSSAPRVRVGDAVEVVLAARRSRAPAAPSSRLVVGRELERSRDRRHLVLVDRDLQRDAVRQLGEPADVGDEHRLAERERADHRARRLAHRRRAQVDEHVARRHQRPQPLLRHVLLADHARRRVEPEPLEPPLEVEPLGRRADEQQPRARPALAAAARTPRAAAGSACSCSGCRSSRSADRPRRRRRRDGRRAATPGAGCARAGPRSPAARARSLDVARVDDHARREVEDRAGEREALGLRLPEQRQQVVEHAEPEQPPGDAERRAPSRRGSRARRRGRS